MDVGLKHFAAEGYHNTTINHIAKHAGISKGLMYNYFVSKEALLAAIINRSMVEITKYFDPNRDGYLSEEEFELFVRKVFLIIKENRSFWRLFYQLLLQKDVRDQFMKSYKSPVESVMVMYSGINDSFMNFFTSVLTDYFTRKKKKKGNNFDPMTELNMFIYTIEGFAMVTAYMDTVDEKRYEKTVDRIIELYK